MKRLFNLLAPTLLLLVGCPALRVLADEADVDVTARALGVLQDRCLACHNDRDQSGGLSLTRREHLTEGASSGPVLIPGDAAASYLMELLQPVGGRAEMPKDNPPLSAAELATLQNWINRGAPWPADRVLESPTRIDQAWWSFSELKLPTLPELESTADEIADLYQPIDAFVLAKLKEHGLEFSAEADRRVLARRLYFDLLGLPPTPEQVQAFIDDPAADAYERLVDRLLQSPHYGERWARHWLDVVQFADTHGYDKDQPRLHAWPYRDYVIRAFNQDKPWSQFIEEQLAGDVLYPGTVDGIEALGFLAAGPWDLVGHAEVPETKIDGQLARHLDRDDMVRTAVQSFTSLTIGCAQCHHHKFDPISQREYYQLQAVFAGLDRADKAYYSDDPRMTFRRQQLVARQQAAQRLVWRLESQVEQRADQLLQHLNGRIGQLESSAGEANPTEAYGYHSQLAHSADDIKWVQLDLGLAATATQLEIYPAFDLFNGIGAAFGFPTRMTVEVSASEDFAAERTQVFQLQAADADRARQGPLILPLAESAVRYVRLTALKLAPRLADDYCFAIAEVRLLNANQDNLALAAQVTAADSIEAPPRWSRQYIVDGIAPRQPSESLEVLVAEREARQRELLGTQSWQALVEARQLLQVVGQQLDQLPAPQWVFAGTVHRGTNHFIGTGHRGGLPREIRVLQRGEVTRPGELVEPGALSLIAGLASEFPLAPDHDEGQRRAALAGWLTDTKNSLVWRSVVNRVWQHHLGQGLVDTPNDFGQMGSQPTHPELLDWLAAQFRDQGQSLKWLHRIIVTSRTYRQVSEADSQREVVHRATAVDSENRLLWRANRRKLDAESVRDSLLAISGRLDTSLYGPPFREFVLEKPEHSPHYRYDLHDFEAPAALRRTIYRFTVRSQLQPFLTALDCADPSQQVARRNESQTPLQVLAMLNNGLVLSLSQHFARRLADEGGGAVVADSRAQVARGFCMAIGRPPAEQELDRLQAYAAEFGLENCCRVLFNLSEFLYVD